MTTPLQNFKRIRLLVFLLPFLSCTKKEEAKNQINGPCADFLAPYASNDGPKQAGTTLHLMCSTNEINVTYEWTGPKNYTSFLQNPTINNISFENGGTYYARIKNATCLSNASPTNVMVDSPCNVSDNSGVFGSTNWSFNSTITCGVNPNSQYYLKGISTNGDLEIRFATAFAPVQNKIYGVDNVSLPAFDSTDVQLFLNSNGTIYTAQSGSIYVSNYGKVTVAFCNIPFKASISGITVTGKAKISCL